MSSIYSLNFFAAHCAILFTLANPGLVSAGESSSIFKDIANSVETILIQPLVRRADRERLWKTLEASARKEVLIVAPEQSIEDALRGKCGSAPPDLMEVLSRLNPGYSLSTSDEERRLQFIPCPYWFFGRDGNMPTTKIREGESLKVLAFQFMGVSGKKTLDNLVLLNPGVFEHGVSKRRAEIRFPYIARRFSWEYPLLASNDTSVYSIVEGVIDVLPKKEGVLARSTAKVSVKNYELVQQVEMDNDDIKRCGFDEGRADWPVDGKRLGEAVNYARAHLVKKSPYGLILMADTGILFDQSLTEWRWENRRVLNGFPSFGNFLNDRFGASMVTREGNDIAPPKGYKFGRHGTDVFRVIAETGRRSHLLDQEGNIAVAKLNSNTAPFSIDAASVSTAFFYGRGIAANVLNLSVVVGQDPVEIVDFLKNSPFVVVAAAGNNGDWLDQLSLFPPSLKTGRDRLIVVGAHDWRGNIAEFSNRGELVDILAPGCAIPINQQDGTAYVSGTSFAAPFVSSTISMLVAVGMPDEPVLLRNRIIVSGRYSPTLDGLTKHGVILDPERAVRVKQDSLLFRGKELPVYGEFRRPQNWTCEVNGVAKNFQPGTVAKIVLLAKLGNQNVTAVWMIGGDGDIRKNYCDGNFESPILSFKPEGSSEFEDFRWGDVVDVVTRISNE